MDKSKEVFIGQFALPLVSEHSADQNVVLNLLSLLSKGLCQQRPAVVSKMARKNSHEKEQFDNV